LKADQETFLETQVLFDKN